MLKSVNAKVDEQLARESHQLEAKKCDRIYAAIEVQVYGVEKISTTN